jgi:hypothetical protein
VPDAVNHDGGGDAAPDVASGNSSVTMRTEERDSLDWEYLLDFRQMVHELKTDDAVCNVEWATYDPVPDFTLETMEHGLGLTVPEFITEFYRLTDGLYLSWDRRTNDGPVPGGGFEVFDFATVFDSWLDTLWANDTPDDCDDDFLWSLRGIAETPADQMPEMIVMCVEEEYPTFDLFIHDADTFDSHLLGLDFHDFLYALLETRGVYGWPYLVCEDEWADNTPQARRRDRARHRLEDWFPDAEI